jgi:hypothetical protein
MVLEASSSGNFRQSQALLRLAGVSNVKGNSDIPLEERQGTLLQGIGASAKIGEWRRNGKEVIHEYPGGY